MAVMACGSRMAIRVWPVVSPIASPASRWPRGREPTPERTSSAITQEL